MPDRSGAIRITRAKEQTLLQWPWKSRLGFMLADLLTAVASIAASLEYRQSSRTLILAWVETHGQCLHPTRLGVTVDEGFSLWLKATAHPGSAKTWFNLHAQKRMTNSARLRDGTHERADHARLAGEGLAELASSSAALTAGGEDPDTRPVWGFGYTVTGSHSSSISQQVGYHKQAGEISTASRWYSSRNLSSAVA